MITILVSMITAASVTAFIHWYLHRANPTATQIVLDSAVNQVKEDVTTVTEAAKDKVGL